MKHRFTSQSIPLVVIFGLFALQSLQAQSTEQWSKTSDIQPQPNRVSKLTPPQIERVKKLQSKLAEVDPSSLDKWIEDFEKDRHPENEIRIWESIASAYQRYSTTHRLTQPAKQEVLSVLLLRSGTMNEAAILQHANLKVLSRTQAREVISEYKGDAEPITVEKK